MTLAEARRERAGSAPAPGGTAAPVVSLAGVWKTFGGIAALSDVSFEVLPGEVHCLAGENGCGKSTLIKIITGVYRPDRGSLRFDGEEVPAMTPGEARRRGIAVIWQDLALFPEMTVAENIAFDGVVGGRLKLADHHRMRRDAAAALKRLGVSLDLDRPLRSLPIASRQLVAIARALVSDARLVFMDEPTASLTHTETRDLLDVVRRLSADGVAVVFVSHRLAEVLEIASRVTVLRDGKLVGVFPTAGMTQLRLGELMTGRQFENVVAARDVGAAPLVLEVEGLTREREFQDVTFGIRAGEVLGLTGLLGAGRTELALTLFGLTRPDRGEMRLGGEPYRPRSVGDAIRAGVAYLSEDRLAIGLVQPQSIADNIALPVLDRVRGALGLLSPRRKDALVRRYVEELAIKIGQPSDAVSTLSGGNQQRVAIAKWLAIEPRVLILDAPTVGVDIGARAGIFRIVRRLAEEGMAILLISDEAPEVHFNADRVLRMTDGRIVATHDPRASTVEALEAAIHG